LENEEIRSHILRILYEHEMQNPAHYFNTDELAPKLAVPSNILDANLLYLQGKGLVQGLGVLGRVTPPIVRITPLGIDVVEHPQWFDGKLSINLHTVSVSGDVYGQVAVAGRDVTQIQASSIDDLRSIVDKREGLSKDTRDSIKSKLGEVEREINSGTVSKTRMEEFKEFFGKYDWLWPVLVSVISKAIGLG
jgi:hypothetical protein